MYNTFIFIIQYILYYILSILYYTEYHTNQLSIPHFKQIRKQFIQSASEKS